MEFGIFGFPLPPWENAAASILFISLLASSDGDTMQAENGVFLRRMCALACRLLKSFPGVYKALHSTHPMAAAETHAVRPHFFDLYPFTKLSVVVFNKPMLEAMEGEKMVHSCDRFKCLIGTLNSQWIALLHDKKEVLDQEDKSQTHEI